MNMKVKVKVKITCLILLITSNIVCSQIEISGYVLTPENEPIEFASVSVYPLNDRSAIKGGVTAEDGKFKIKNLDNDSYVLTIQMLGYEDSTKQINVSGDLQIEPIKLKVQSTTLDEIQIVAEQSTLESHLGKKVLRIGKDLSSTASNALEALDNIPSVTTTPRGQIQIRGNSNVIIYINGKATRRDPASLKYIAAQNLEKIEIITNPSAKYDSEGVGGIINLVYKNDKSSNVKLELISNLTILSNPFYLNPNGGINASLAKEKISFFVNLYSDHGKYTDYVDAHRSNKMEELQYYENSTVQNGIGSISNIIMGCSFEPDSSSSIGLEINYDRWDLKNNIQQNNLFSYLNKPDQQLTLSNTREELENELWISLSLDKEFQNEKKNKNKKNLQISLSAGGENESNFSDSERLNFTQLSENAVHFLKSSDEKESQKYFQANLDYELPFFNWGSIETGFKADLIYYDVFQEVELRSDDIQIPKNEFNMEMQKFGLYLIQKKKIDKLEYAIGLRMEQFSSKAFQQSDQSNFTQKYIRLFPSAQFNYMISDSEQSIGINYTRKINRPGFFDLNPYVSYEDPLNLSTGNPALKPEIADLLELNYHQEWKVLNVDLTFYQRNTIDAIQTVAASIDENRTITTSANIGKERNRGLEAQLDFRPFKALKSTNIFVVSQNKFQDDEKEISYNQKATWNLQLKQSLQLNNKWKFELTEIYRAPSYQIQEKIHENFYVNMGLRKKFKDNKGSFSLGVRDLFNTRVYQYSLLSSDFEIEQSYKWQTRQITLGLVYTLIDKTNDKTNR